MSAVSLRLRQEVNTLDKALFQQDADACWRTVEAIRRSIQQQRAGAAPAADATPTRGSPASQQQALLATAALPSPDGAELLHVLHGHHQSVMHCFLAVGRGHLAVSYVQLLKPDVRVYSTLLKECGDCRDLSTLQLALQVSPLHAQAMHCCQIGCAAPCHRSVGGCCSDLVMLKLALQGSPITWLQCDCCHLGMQHKS